MLLTVYQLRYSISLFIFVLLFLGINRQPAFAELPTGASLDQILINLGVMKPSELSGTQAEVHAKPQKLKGEEYSIQVSSQNRTVNIQKASEKSSYKVESTALDSQTNSRDFDSEGAKGPTFLAFGRGGFDYSDIKFQKFARLKSIDDVETIGITKGPGEYLNQFNSTGEIGAEGRRWHLAAAEGFFPTLFSETFSSRVLPVVREQFPEMEISILKGYRDSSIVPMLGVLDAEKICHRFNKQCSDEKGILYGRLPGGWKLSASEFSSDEVVAYFSIEGKLLNGVEIQLHEQHSQEMYFVVLNLSPGYRLAEMESFRDGVNHQSGVFLPIISGAATYHEFETPSLFNLNFTLKADVEETNGSCILEVENTKLQSYSLQPTKAFFREVDFHVKIDNLLLSPYDPVFLKLKCNSEVAIRQRVMPGDIHDAQIILPSRKTTSSFAASKFTPYFFPNLLNSRHSILIKTNTRKTKEVRFINSFNLETLIGNSEGMYSEQVNGFETLVYEVNSLGETRLPDKNKNFEIENHNAQSNLFNFYILSKPNEQASGILEFKDSNGKTTSSDWIKTDAKSVLYLF